MTQLIDAVRLQALSAYRPQPGLPADRAVPMLHWTIDPATGRPVGTWKLAARQPAASLLAEP